ncbi:MAG: hypothetical protein KatS3mg131_0933 [Candidatus Tectimicrobiota bacterium]|nr:MAG: hypothetical protein KatS3mg131_0933 [Candidatus Tectomicrobia bacterium]
MGLLAGGCAPPVPPSQPPTAPSATRAEDFLVVDCLLPAQVRQLGAAPDLPGAPSSHSHLCPRLRLAGVGNTSLTIAANYATALKVWLPLAKQGDPEAQTNVGEIYEKGLGVPPDYAQAAAWYRKAAEQGFARAQINLGHLYEKGLGVPKDPVQALHWYRQAAGLSQGIALDIGTLKAAAQEELATLREEVARWQREAETLRAQLKAAQEQLERLQQQLRERQSQVEAERQALAQARRELEAHQQQDATTRQQLAAQLARREAELERQRAEVARLQQEIARLQADTVRYRAQLTQVERRQQEVAVAPPTITVIDPPLAATRGLVRVSDVTTAGQPQRLVVGRVEAPAGLLSLTVNGHETQPEAGGVFRVTVPVAAGRTPVRIVAVDRQGKHASLEFVLTTAAAAQESTTRPLLPAADFGTYHALIIGNSHYAHWPDLQTPHRDAREVDRLLRGKYGFRTRVLLDATRYDILQALNELRRQLTERDNLLIYYAGHGYLDPQIDRGYWIPVDAHLDSNVQWISTLAITDMVAAMSAKHVLVVADSCYAGALTRSALVRLESGMSAEARQHWLRLMAAKRSRTVLTAGDLQPVLDSGGGGHSVFARAFLAVLADNLEVLEGQRLHQEIAARVTYAAAAALVEQVPQYAPLRYAGHEAGDFLFVPQVN